MKCLLSTLPAAVLALLAGCGGGNDKLALPDSPAHSAAAALPEVGPQAAASPAPRAAGSALALAEPLPPGVPESYMNRCVQPTGNQRAGTLRDEQSFLRLWAEETYLWNKEIPDVRMADYGNAVDYFQALKTPALTASGRAKDRFHFSYPEAQWLELSQGVSLGYGLTWVRNTGLPRQWLVAAVEPGSPAAAAGIRRGDELLAVDRVDFQNANSSADVARLNAGLFPKAEGERHVLRLAHGWLGRRDASLAAARVSADPVPKAQVLETAAGKVGYLVFNNHIDLAEQRLIDAFTQLREAGVRGLVLDLRYNGGGLVSVASEVAYMVAGPQRTLGQVFEQMLTNNPAAQRQPTRFIASAMGLVPGQRTPRGTPLPYLGLDKVTVIAGPGTCSASESIINGLRGVGVEVELVGNTTCGKPYAFVPTPNCGNYYFMIQFQGVNAKGWGDYGDGFAPTCTVRDDMQYELGDARETLLKAALLRNTTGQCPAPAAGARLRSAAPLPVLVPVRPDVSELKILR